MNTQIRCVVAALLAGLASGWVGASTLPAYETYSAAADTVVQGLDVTSDSGATAQISGNTYAASASTALASNHAYASVSSTPDNVFSVNSFSGWYDKVTITGGTGADTLAFTVQLNGLVDVGQYAGSMAYGLYASPLHPTQLVDTLNIVDPVSLALAPWALNAPLGFNTNAELTAISTYRLGASPYNDTSILFPVTGEQMAGIPAAAGLAIPDLMLTPGVAQRIDIALHGTLDFTYGEAFYLIAGLGVSVFGDGLESSCITIGPACTAPEKDGTGATNVDFANGATLVSIVLPSGAAANFASGAHHPVTAVPEPREWAMLLAGLGLVGWRARRRPA